MQKNSDDFSMQDALKLAKSPAAQQLLSLLQQTDAQALSKAMDQAKGGDYTAASQSLSSMLSNPDVQKLLGELRR